VTVYSHIDQLGVVDTEVAVVFPVVSLTLPPLQRRRLFVACHTHTHIQPETHTHTLIFQNTQTVQMRCQNSCVYG